MQEKQHRDARALCRLALDVAILSRARTLRACPQVLDVVRKFNADPNVNGILVQLPLPAHINEEKILDAISIDKDVDGAWRARAQCAHGAGKPTLAYISRVEPQLAAAAERPAERTP